MLFKSTNHKNHFRMPSTIDFLLNHVFCIFKDKFCETPFCFWKSYENGSLDMYISAGSSVFTKNKRTTTKVLENKNFRPLTQEPKFFIFLFNFEISFN